MKEALLYDSEKSGLVKCKICPRECVISPIRKNFSLDQEDLGEIIKKDNLGFCGTRINILGKLYAINYGRITGLEIEPIEKKLIYHFMPGTKTLSLGSFGCNFRCPNCYNWQISQTSSLIQNKPDTVFSLAENFPEISPGDIVNQAIENKCASISYTYNEPTVSFEFNLKTMRLARKAKIKNIWITNGFISAEALKMILPFLDAVNLDIKSFNENFYTSHPKGSLIPVLENLMTLAKNKIHLEITTLIIPKLSNHAVDLKALASFIKKYISRHTPWHLIDFSSSVSWQMEEWASATEKDILKACLIGKNEGLEFVYSNLGDKLKNTYCPHCRKLNIKRFEYEIERHDDRGFCSRCGRKLFIRDEL